MEEFVGLDSVEGGFERQALMDAKPLPDMAMPLDVESVTADPVGAGEGGVEFFAEVVGE